MLSVGSASEYVGFKMQGMPLRLNFLSPSMSLAIDSRIFGAHAAPHEHLKFRSPLVIPVIDDFAFAGGITPVSNRNILLLAMPQPRHDYGKPLLWFVMVAGRNFG